MLNETQFNKASFLTLADIIADRGDPEEGSRTKCFSESFKCYNILFQRVVLGYQVRHDVYGQAGIASVKIDVPYCIFCAILTNTKH